MKKPLDHIVDANKMVSPIRIQQVIKILAIKEPGKPWVKAPHDAVYVWSTPRLP